MSEIIIASSEGEWALTDLSLSPFGADDFRRGSVLLSGSAVLLGGWEEGQASDDMWFHFRMGKNDTNSLLNIGTHPIRIRDNALRPILGWRTIVRTSGALGIYAAWAPSPSTGLTGESAELLTVNNQVFMNLDIRARRSTTTTTNDTLTADWYIDNQLRHSVTLLNAGGWPDLRQIFISSFGTPGVGGGEDSVFQDIIVTDSIPTVGMELATLAPTGDGNYTDFTGTFADIDEEGYNSADLIVASSAGQRQSFTLDTATISGGDKVVYGLALVTVAKTDLAGIISDFQPFLRIDAIDYSEANINANFITPTTFVTLWTENPSTNTAWERADFDGFEAGYLAV